MAILKSTQVKGNLSVEKNLTVDGNLNVQGDLTYIGVNNLRVKDKQIELNATDSGLAPAGTANEAGIVIRGARKSGDDVVNDASILYDNSDDTLVVNKTIKGTVSKATTAASADKVAQKLIVNVTNESGSKTTVEFDGSAEKTVDVNLKGLQDQINNLTGGADSIKNQIDNAINALNSEVQATASGTAHNGGVFVLQGVKIDESAGKLTLATPTAVEVEQAGAAATVKTELIGGDNDNKNSATIAGAKKYADSLASHYAAASHTHEINDVNGLQGALDGKAAKSHTHTTSEITGLDTALTGKQDALSEAQLAAVDSGVTAAKVTGYDNHVANGDIHVTADLKAKWNAIEQKANKYTDDEIKKLDLGSAAQKNVLTGTIADSPSSDNLVTAAQVTAYADTQDAATLASAKAYTDTTAVSAAAKAVADVVAGAPSDFDTLKEVADWIQNDKTGAAALQTDVAGLKTDVAGLKTDVAGLNTKVSDLKSASHTHTNKAELDKIKDGDKANWDGHVADADIHVTAEQKTTWSGKQDALANAATLAAITSTQVTNWDSAATKAHEHTNKTVLDGITADKVAAWDGAANAAVVNSVGGKSGALTLKGGSKTLGDVNLSISDTGEISAAIVPNSFDSFGSAATALNDAKDYASGLAKNYDAAGAAATALNDAKSYADEKVSALSGSVATTDAAQDTKISNIEKSITGIQNNYVKKAGDTMTGNLTMPSNGANGIVFGDMKIVWNSADKAIEFVPTA